MSPQTAIGHFDRAIPGNAGRSTVTLSPPQHSAPSKASNDDRPATHQAAIVSMGNRLVKREHEVWGGVTPLVWP